MKKVAHWLKLVATNFKNSKEKITQEVIALCKQFPIYDQK